MPDTERLLICSPSQRPRLRYALDLLFTQLLGLEYRLVTEGDAHLYYDDTAPSGALHMIPSGLLERTGIEQDLLDQIHFEVWEGSHAAFRTGARSLPFDLFSATFFLCSRYEEYLDFYPDEHDRFTARESVLFQADLLGEPLVNQWALILKDRLLEAHPTLSFRPRTFQYHSTIDVDQTWKYRRKGLDRNLAGFFRDLLHGKWENFRERWPVLLGLKKDPFFNFAWQEDIHKRYGIEVSYFFLLADRSQYDKNIRHTDLKQQALILHLSKLEGSRVGIHPSYRSAQLINAQHPQAVHDLRTEINRLKHILGNVDISRQHFLMHRFPQTPEILAQLGIREEHSMGYSSMAGFRAGIAAPFAFYDLRREQITDLIQIPFCLMDITPLHYLELNPTAAVEHMRSLMNKVKEVGGLFVSLWHNESLSETERWKGWRILYEEMLKEASS